MMMPSPAASPVVQRPMSCILANTFSLLGLSACRCSCLSRCNTTQGVLPFIVSPSYYPRASPFFGSLVTEYCFTLNTLPAAAIVPSTCYKANDLLAKIEWYADEALRSAVKGYTITPFGGPSKKVFPSWGAPGTSTLKGMVIAARLP
ncbi:hypothetical protein Vretimale_13858 [Volvox reticuliferus]|uniref:Pherophorin domain-containing protein n=1 Tax=Volvox reticuliferus TaxID=1737510 RepID=A0A8J4GMC0_9CHLO|nr:hypothetical protein Vretimale_13858 [Volvox reticuliferus]GIM10085.1 hypothetical protein Vretimale_13858 [Volvox reticuliferus]